MELILHGAEHALIDTLKIWPLLFLTYLLMEYLEHRAGSKMIQIVQRSGRTGPLWGGLLGMIPQCGLAGAAAGFYSGRVITVGTLFAVFLATSDEMLPILISAAAPVETILKILLSKLAIAVILGFLIDAIWKPGQTKHDHFCTICKDEHCGCEKSIWRGALHHSLHIAAFLFLITVALELVIETSGLEEMHNSVLHKPVIGVLIATLVGLIPNCSSSVVLTELYLEGLFTAGAMMGGLLVNAGVGLLVLFRVNKNWHENVKILILLMIIGLVIGSAIELTGIQF